MSPVGEEAGAGSAVDPLLGAESVLGQMAAGVVVIDRDGCLLYANDFAVSLFGFPDDARHLAGKSLLSLGFEEGDARRARDMTRQVLRGWPWEGTFATMRVDGSRMYMRAHATPMCGDDGEITGIVIVAREATRRGGQRENDRIGLLERIGERLSGSLELSVTLKQVAQTLVPQFADHCFIDLFQGDKLVRRVQFNSRGWMPDAGQLGAGRRADQLPGGALLPAGDGPDGHRRGDGPVRGPVPRAEPRQRADLR